MFKVPEGAFLAQAALADRLICWSRQSGHPMRWASGPPPSDRSYEAEDTEYYVWTTSYSRYGLLLCCDADFCAESGVPLVLYDGGPNVCPEIQAMRNDEVYYANRVDALPRDYDCNATPTPPSDTAITGIDPAGVDHTSQPVYISVTGVGFLKAGFPPNLETARLEAVDGQPGPVYPDYTGVMSDTQVDLRFDRTLPGGRWRVVFTFHDGSTAHYDYYESW